MLVRSALIPNPLVVRPEVSVVEFVDAVLNSNQTTAAVVDGERLVGVVSVRDIFDEILPAYVDMDEKLAGVLHARYFDEQFARLRAHKVESLMVREVDTLKPEDAIMKAVAMFVRHGRKTIPVLESGRYVGSVTRRSVLMAVRHTGTTGQIEDAE